MEFDYLPEGWSNVRFDEMAAMVSERVDPAEAEVDVYVGLEHLEPNNLRIKEHGVPSDVKGQKLRFRPGHIIFGRRRAYQRKLAVAECEGICSAHAMVLEAKPEVVHPDFLPFFMQSDLFMDRAVQISVGGLSPTINWKTLCRQNFVLPPMERQRELLDAFQDVERVLVRNEEALSASLALRKSVRRKLLKPQDDWRSFRLKDIAEVRLGRQRSPDKQTGEHFTPYLRAANIKRGRIDFSDVLEMDFTPDEVATYELLPGDILLVEGGELEDVGDPAIYTDEMPAGHCLQNTLIRIRSKTDDAKPSFLFWLLTDMHRQGAFRGIAAGTKLLHIGATRTGNMKIWLPGTKYQEQVIEIMQEVDQGVKKLHNYASDFQVLKRELLTSLLLGDRKSIDEAAPIV